MVTTAVTPEGGIEIGGTADVAFVHGSGQAAVDIVVEWDFDGDGDFDEPEENITGFLVEGESLVGRDFPSQLTGKSGPGDLRLTLRNDDGRFSFFNAASPLKQPPFSLGSGRKIRVRTTTAANPDPVLLARDRFVGSGALGADELGNTWTAQSGVYTRSDGYAVHTGPKFTDAAATVAAAEDCYIQATSRQRHGGADVGIVYRFQDVDNFGWVCVVAGSLRHRVVTGGVVTSDASMFSLGDTIEDAMTFGVHVDGTTATVYLEGAPVGTATAASFSSDDVGIRAGWWDAAAPAYDRFDVWAAVPAEVEGILWTGHVESVVPLADLGPNLTVMVQAEGPLAQLATSDVTPTAQTAGLPTGIAVGHILGKAGAAHPPGLIDEGDITTGAYGFDPRPALELARLFEETEGGFLREMQEGYVAYDAHSARVGAVPAAWFSDDPAAQFGYSRFGLADWRREVINQVAAGVAPSPPVVESVTTRTGNTAATVQNDVSVQMPATVDVGDLLLVVISSTVIKSQHQWETVQNAGWQQLRNEGYTHRLRAYAKVATALDPSRSYTFYDDVTPFPGGAWVAKVFRISNWYGELTGVAQGDMAVAWLSGGDPNGDAYRPPTLVTPWGLQPALFIAARGGMTSAFGGVDSGAAFPVGYTGFSSTMLNGTVNGFDVSLGASYRQAYTATEDVDVATPDTDNFGGWEFVNSCLFAVRGFDGSPPEAGGQVVTVSDLASQDRHGGIPRSHTLASRLFASEDDAEQYGLAVLLQHAADRPVVTVEFPATLNAAYRNQAIRRRVGHKIHLTADGDTGMGIDGDFFIEHIHHSWPDPTRWLVTWQLSPA